MYFVFTLIWLIVSTFGCKDENGKVVDWFLVYKLPKVNNKNGFNQFGARYVYLTNQNINQASSWTLSKKSINSQDSILAKNFKSLYSQKNTRFSHLFYNDDPPNSKSDSNVAHSKGSLIIFGNEGSWLVHSIPNFPLTVDQNYSYPNTGLLYGQIIFCVRFKVDESITKIAKYLSLLRPKVYSHHFTKTLNKKAPELKDLVDRKWSKMDIGSTEIKTHDGITLYGFARNGKAKSDLYTEILASSLLTSLFVETWRRGAGGARSSDCNIKYQVTNIKSLRIKFSTQIGSLSHQVWTYIEDHSKWAISHKVDKPYVCIGDVNRMNSQIKRGGGALCMQHLNLWKSFRDMIQDIELCAKNNFVKYFKSVLLFMFSLSISILVSL